MSVLIIGRPKEGHVALVSKYLSVPYTIIDTRDIRDGAPLSFSTDGKGAFRITYQGKELTDVTAVWCYKLAVDFKDAKFKVSEAFEDYRQLAVRNFINTLSVSFADAFWISPYQAMLRAVNKQYQLASAAPLGFHIPETLISSDPVAAKAFIEGHESTVVKPFSTKIMAREDGSGTYFFAAKIKKGESLDYNRLPIAPFIFQAAIDPVYDVRVFVIGEVWYAASITGKETESDRNRDWRMAQFNGSMQVAALKLPVSIATKCVQLVKRMGLAYGAIDLLLDKSGKYWFLEVNTTGSWRFIEDRTKQPIAATIARLLESAGKAT